MSSRTTRQQPVDDMPRAMVGVLAAVLLIGLVIAGPAASAPLATDAAISASVTLVDGSPVEGVIVDLYEADEADEAGQRAGYLRSISTDPGGEGTFEVESGCYVTVAIAPDGDGFIGGGSWDEQANCADAGEAVTARSTLGGADGSQLGGRVVDIDGADVGGVTVDVFAAAADGGRARFLADTTTGDDGRYRFDLLTGCYVVVLIAPDGREFVSGHPWDEQAACISDGSPRTDLDATLGGTGRPPVPPVPPVDAFACLNSSTTTRIDTTWRGRSIVGKIAPGHVGPGAGIDLRGTSINVHDRSQDAIDDSDPVIDSRWGLVQFKSSTDLCAAGGEIASPNPYNITWQENYDTEGLGTGYRRGTTRNHAAVDTAGSDRPTISGLYFFNLHDGIRVNDSEDWRAEHVWGDYTRDDCIENDTIASGVIHDSLFDGCYTGYSNRATATEDDNGNPITGIGDVVTFDRVLLRMEMMPGPYKACERISRYYGADREPYSGSPCVDRDVYGTGLLFKLVDQGDPTGSINPNFRFIDSVFVVEQVPIRSGESRADFPPESKIEECSNVTIIYLGTGPYPGRLPPAGCYTLLTGEAGRRFWVDSVTDWHARHPDVAPERTSPDTYGDLTFPRPGFNDPER